MAIASRMQHPHALFGFFFTPAAGPVRRHLFWKPLMKTRKSAPLALPRIRDAILLALLGLALGFASRAQGAEYTVEMTSDSRFSPSYLEIQLGDTVTWVNRDWAISHNSFGLDAYWYWDSQDLEYGEAYSLQFPIVGSFAYIDTDWWVLGMSGTIVVKPAIPLLMDPTRLGNGSFQFTVSNLVVSATYIIQGSTNLVNWTNLATNVAASAIETFTDSSAAAVGRRFYRSSQLP
jgi:plastocyanin